MPAPYGTGPNTFERHTPVPAPYGTGLECLMPIYEFRCGSCGGRFERLLDAGIAEAECPVCGEGAERVLSAPSPPSHLMTPAQRRRSEASRGIDRGGARQRFGERLRRGREAGRAKGSGGGDRG